MQWVAHSMHACRDSVVTLGDFDFSRSSLVTATDSNAFDHPSIDEETADVTRIKNNNLWGLKVWEKLGIFSPRQHNCQWKSIDSGPQITCINLYRMSWGSLGSLQFGYLIWVWELCFIPMSSLVGIIMGGGEGPLPLEFQSCLPWIMQKLQNACSNSYKFLCHNGSASDSHEYFPKAFAQ